MKNYFRKMDGLGATPTMTYKTKATYGTTLSGCFSCCAYYFVIFYVCLILLAFITNE